MDKDTKRHLGLIFLFVFVDLLGYSLILPLLPYFAETYSASLTTVGLLGTANALAQLIAAPVIGRFSDRYGRRPLLIFSIAGTVLSFTLLGLARSLPIIFLSRILDGLLGGNIALARAYITDVTDEQNRARGLGIIGAAFGLGFIVGPAMGGFLSRFGYNIPALLAAGLSLVNLVAVLLWLPESLSPERRSVLRHSPKTGFTFKALRQALTHPCAGPLLILQLFYGLAFTLFQSNFTLFVKERWGLTAENTSFVLTYVGVLSVIVQGFAIGRLTRRFGERKLMVVGMVGLAGTLTAWAFVPTVAWLLIVLAPLALAGGILGVMLTSQLTQSVTKEEVGGTLGLSAASQTLAQIVAPGMGGWMLEHISIWSVGLLAGLVMTGAVFFAQRHVLSVPESELACYLPE
ncbi:MAG: MFS transporter [Anaerolineae bacterium]|nr:MFS transporter [Anaerolineae bacterium]